MSNLELWGGHECTLNRVGDRYQDQTERSGHGERPQDIELFAGLGIKRLRYPALWERTERTRGVLDFTWLDDRLARLAKAEVQPILGLLHHGSGPLWTSLLDEAFPQAFAGFAAAVAARFPEVNAYTPINEPLTTARFSCLYGHWYPHLRDERSMWLATLNQIDATRLAMRAIRAVNPGAQLVQTEDLGRCQSTPRLAYQAAFENKRRWLTWDLLEGNVTPDHPLHAHLAGFGLDDRLARIADDPCPPDVVGVNHYPTSERFLDERVARYPSSPVGGNGRDRYVDLEAVRVSDAGVCGFGPLLEETWRRYRRPVAVTECHINCTREEQLRWLVEAWTSAQRLRDEGCDIRALTAWSLLGAYDWNSLLTRDEGHYEGGVFDLRAPEPRPTALADTIGRLARGEPVSALATGPGWWRREARLTLGRSARPAQAVLAPSPPAIRTDGAERRPILITGATGTLGQALARACALRDLPFVLTDRSALRIDEQESVESALETLRPWAVINAAGWVRVDEAETQEAACFAANTCGPTLLAQACARAEIPFVTFSTDLVFDGAQDRPYVETDEARPLNAYGRSKLAAEQAVAAAGGRALIVRTSAFFQERDPHNFAMQTLKRLAAGEQVEAADDLIMSPTYVVDLVWGVLELLIDGEAGLWHLSNPSQVSWCDFARLLATAAGHDPRRIVGRPAAAFGWPARRPVQAALGSSRGRLLPPLDYAISRFIHDYGVLRKGEREKTRRRLAEATA